MARQPSHPSSSGLHRQQSTPHAAGMTRQSSASGMHRSGSLTAPLQRGNSPALQRRSEQSPNPHRRGASPAMQRPDTASSGWGATQRQPSVTTGGGILKPSALASLLRQASSPGVQRPERPATVMQRQGGVDSRPRHSRSPDLQTPEASTAAGQRQGSRAGQVRGSSPGALPPPVVAADFARQRSSVLSAFPSEDLAGRSERVSLLLTEAYKACGSSSRT